MASSCARTLRVAARGRPLRISVRSSFRRSRPRPHQPSRPGGAPSSATDPSRAHAGALELGAWRNRRRSGVLARFWPDRLLVRWRGWAWRSRAAEPCGRWRGGVSDRIRTSCWAAHARLFRQACGERLLARWEGSLSVRRPRSRLVATRSPRTFETCRAALEDRGCLDIVPWRARCSRIPNGEGFGWRMLSSLRETRRCASAVRLLVSLAATRWPDGPPQRRGTWLHALGAAWVSSVFIQLRAAGAVVSGQALCPRSTEGP